MDAIFQQVFLSDIALFALLGVLMLLVTFWAYSTKEYAGYILGWLLGILLIILTSVFTTRSAASSETAATTVIQGPFVLFGLVVAAVAGTGIGFGGLALVGSERYQASRVRRGLAVAIATSFTLTAGYLMMISGYSTRLTIVVFMLALAIGALINFILSRNQQRQQATSADLVDHPAAIDIEHPADPPVDPIVTDLPSPLAQRVHNIRTRIRRRGDL